MLFRSYVPKSSGGGGVGVNPCTRYKTLSPPDLHAHSRPEARLLRVNLPTGNFPLLTNEKSDNREPMMTRASNLKDFLKFHEVSGNSSLSGNFSIT